MPELPEVERARRELASIAEGRRIHSVQTWDDNIVFSQIHHLEWAEMITGKVVVSCKRRGKNFYLVLKDSLHHPIFHLGMSGSTRVRGEEGASYHRVRTPVSPVVFPPKYVKCTITFVDPVTAQETGEWAFADVRRLGRIKLVNAENPEDVPPLSLLGRDPFLDMPSIDELYTAVQKRKAPIKAVLLDQNQILCGIGNWMIDEILYQSRIHPSHTASMLSLEEVTTLHEQIINVTITACNVNARSSQFPRDWLFKARWSKGKTNAKDFTLPDGSTEAITFLTVGGRTSAIIASLQILPDQIAATLAEKASKVKPKKAAVKEKAKGKRSITNVEEDEEEDGNAAEEEKMEEEAVDEPITSPYFKRTRSIPSTSLTTSPHFDSPLDALKSPSRRSSKPSDSLVN